MSSLQLYFSLHMIGMALWVGQALLLPIVIIPAVKVLEDAGQLKFMETFTRKYIPWFIGAAVVMILTGVMQILSPDLWGEMDGNMVLITKHVVSSLCWPRRSTSGSSWAANWGKRILTKQSSGDSSKCSPGCS